MNKTHTLSHTKKMKELNQKEMKLLAMALNKSHLSTDDCIRFYRTPHHIKAVLKRLVALGYLNITEFGKYVITNYGKEALGIEVNKTLEEFK